MKRVIIILLFGLLVTGTLVPSWAITPVWSGEMGMILSRMSQQEKRIDRGIAIGQLSRSEANILRDNLSWIRRQFRLADGNGRLSPREQAQINRLLDSNSRMIEDKRHNRVIRLY